MRFLNTTSDFMHRPIQPILDMMSGVDFGPFFTKWNSENLSDRFTVPVGEGWTDDTFRLRFVIPGVERDKFELTTQGTRLTLRGRRIKPDTLDSSEDFHFAMPYGHFERTVDLPQGLDLEKMEANFHHGVLDVRIHMERGMQARMIPISVAEERVAVPA